MSSKNISGKLSWFGWFLVLGVFLLAVTGLFLYLFANHHGTKLPLDPLVVRYSPPGVNPPKNVKHFVLSEGKNAAGGKTVRVPILLYHYIEDNKDPKDTIRIGLTVTPYYFEKQLQTLTANGYTAITFHDLYEAVTSGQNLPTKPVILTFDDGYRDFYTDAFPLLKKYQTKATNFVIANHVGRSGNLTGEMIKELIASKLVTIGAHTLNHTYLAGLSKEKAWEEINGSKAKLESDFGIKVSDFAYPYGAFNKELEELVQMAGFETASSTTLGATHDKNTLLRLSRIRVGNYDGKLFLNRLEREVK